MMMLLLDWVQRPVSVQFVLPVCWRDLALDHDGPSGAKTHFVSFFGTPHADGEIIAFDKAAPSIDHFFWKCGKW